MTTKEAALRLDPEFSAIVPPLSAAEFALLEANIVAEGCHDPLVAWAEKGILLDGHNRYRICKEQDIAFDVRDVTLPDRDTAKVWIIKNQFSRRNLTPYQRAELALKLEPLIAQAAQERMKASTPVPNSEQGRTVERVAEIAGVGKDTIAKAEFLSEHADEGAQGPESSTTSAGRVQRGARGGIIEFVITEGPDNLPESPSPNGLDGRDGNGHDPLTGRFVRNNRCSRGNPLGGRVTRLRAAMLKAVRPEDVRAVVAAMLLAAKTGDVAAAKLVLNYAVGEPGKVAAEPAPAALAAVTVNVGESASPSRFREMVAAIGGLVPRGEAEAVRQAGLPPATAGRDDD